MEPFIGMVLCFAGPFVPRNWAPCDGRTLSIAKHPSLFKLLGTTYGGNGIHTFNLPDLRGRTAVSAGKSEFSSYKTGDSLGIESFLLKSNQMPKHTHNGTIKLQLQGRTDAGIDPTVNGGYPSEFTHAYTTSGDEFMAEPVYTVDSGPAGSGTPVNARSAFLVINYIICLEGIFPARS